MYIDQALAVVTIATSDTVSASIYLKNGVAGAIITPSSLTSTTLSFQVSNNDVDYTALYDTSGSLISYTVAANRVIPLSKEIFGAFPYLKIVTGSSEAANRTFIVLIRAG